MRILVFGLAWAMSLSTLCAGGWAQRHKGRRAVPPVHRAPGLSPPHSSVGPPHSSVGPPRSFVPPREMGVRPPANPIRPAVAPQDQEALALLKLMLFPTADYAGEQITQSGAKSSRQRIFGNTRRRVRRDFLSPSEWSGDIMLIGPGQYQYYHALTGMVDIAYGPVSDGTLREGRIMAAIRAHKVAVTITGQETVAGRSATIVELSAPSGEEGIWKAQFSIDPQTGILLHNRMMNARGITTSESRLESITIGPAAGINPAVFNPLQVRNAKPNILFPNQERLHSLAEAQGKLNFTPVTPTHLPSGFSLTGIWLQGINNRSGLANAVWLRYSNGVATFSLRENLMLNQATLNERQLGPNAFKRYQLSWRVTSVGANLNITYIGTLPPDELEALYNSIYSIH